MLSIAKHIRIIIGLIMGIKHLGQQVARPTTDSKRVKVDVQNEQGSHYDSRGQMRVVSADN